MQRKLKFRLTEISKRPIFAAMMGKYYYDYLEFLDDAQGWGSEKIRSWQWKKIMEIVTYAYNHVPYYKKLYHNAGFEPGDLKSWNDFFKLPMISSDDIKKYEKDFYSDEVNRIKHYHSSTSGSTGKAMSFIQDRDIDFREHATYTWYWKSLGFNPGDKCLVLRGNQLMGEDGNFRYRYSVSNHYYRLDSKYINRDHIREYDRIIRKSRAENIQAYTSSMEMLARCYAKERLDAPRIKRIFLGSETITDDQIELIRQVFNPEMIVNQYGHSERVLLAFQNVKEDGMGFVPFYGYAELVDENGNEITKDEEIGEIVGTGFSKSMPFIRYKTSDLAEYSSRPFERNMVGWKRVKRILGRSQEYIITTDGGKLPLVLIDAGHIPELSAFEDFQYVQNEKGSLIINAKVDDDSDALADIDIIEKKITSLFNGKVVAKIRLNGEIFRTKNNKKHRLIQNLRIQ